MSDQSREIAVACLWLPDDNLWVFQRRGERQTSSGLLGMFGGHVEWPGDLGRRETPHEAVVRELQEETAGLTVARLGLELLETVTDIPKRKGLTVHFFLGQIPADEREFKVIEGAGAEAYTLPEMQDRMDVSPTARHAVNLVLATRNF